MAAGNGIALRSRFAFKPVPQSLRHAEIKEIKRILVKKDFPKSYLVVTGGTGVGKTCLIKTATSKTPGVINVLAWPGDSVETIIENTFQELVKLPYTFMDVHGSAKRVIFWYSLLTFGRSPIVVIKAADRMAGQQKYAELTGAVRTLVEKYKLRVVVDGSPDSFAQSLLRTGREHVIDVKAMSREMIWQLEQLQDLFKYVKEAGLEDMVFAVIGGIPSSYEQLWDNFKFHEEGDQNPRQVIGNHLCAEVFDAIGLVQMSKTITSDMDEIIRLFDKEKMSILRVTLVDKNLERPSHDNVFREAQKDGRCVLNPASNAIGIVLRHNIEREPTLNGLEELLKL